MRIILFVLVSLFLFACSKNKAEEKPVEDAQTTVQQAVQPNKSAAAASINAAKKLQQQKQELEKE